MAAQAGKIYAYEWDVATDAVVRSGGVASVLGPMGETPSLTRQQLLTRVHPDDRALFIASASERTPENPDSQIRYRMLRPDGSVIWLEKTAHAFFDEHGRMVRQIGMVADITERKRAEERLREYEKAVEGAEEMIAVVDREYRYLIANRQFLKMRNVTSEQVVGRFVHEVLNEGVFEAVVKEKLDECFQGKVVRYEMKYTYSELGERDLLISYFPIEGTSGIDRVACILQDITDRKQAEKVLAGMSQKLIEAQEQERARIARELHDDINQRLAMLAIELDQLREHSPELTPDRQQRIEQLRQETTVISSGVQALSHDLHFSQMEYLGVVAGMKSWSKEFSERHGMQIDCRHDVRSTLPTEIGLCLFRILQEALHNAVKHSGVKRVAVQLREDSGEIHLVISDTGRGFDTQTVVQGRGLGLISMRERVRLVSGTIVIDSKPMGGTTIHVRVPFKSEKLSTGAVG